MSTPDNRTADERAAQGRDVSLTWDNGRSREPYANRGPAETPPQASPEVADGNRGNASGRNQEQEAAVSRDGLRRGGPCSD